MIQVKRIVADIRGPGQSENEAEYMVNEELMNLQQAKNGGINIDIEIRDIHEITKTSGAQVFLVIYNDKSLDLSKPNA